MQPLTLVEYQSCSSVPLTLEQLDELRRVAPSVDVSPTPGRTDHYELRPGSFVGAVNLPGLAIEIQPKIPIDRLLFLISYVLGHRKWQEVPFDLEQAPSLVEAIVPGFVAQVRRAFQRGVLQGYRVEETALQTIRGRVRFDDQLRSRYGRFPPAEVRYDDYTEDIEENRVLKAAFHRLGRLRLRSQETRRALRSFDEALASVRPVEYDARQLPTIAWTRLNERYRPAVELALLILRATSFDTRHGAVAASSFLLDMNQVFEDFVTLALRDQLRLSERAFPQGNQGRQLRLDAAGRVRLLPDLSWWEAGRCVFVGDAKYKRIEDNVKHADLYQLLAYTIATDLPGGLLIYADGADASHTIVNLGKLLDIATLDLSGTPDDVLGQIAGIARRIRMLRQSIVEAA